MLSRLSLALAVLSLSLTAFAAKPRVVVAFDEAVDGKASTVREAEAAVVRQLTSDGYRVISGKIAEEVRKAQAADFAADGKVPEALSAIDAEFILTGKIEGSHFGSLDAVSVHSYRANGTAYLVRVDTAEIVATFAVEGSGESFGKRAAAQSAVKAAGKDIGTQLIARLAALDKAPKTIDVTLYGVPDRKAGKAVKAALLKVEGIDKVTVRTSARGVSKLEIEASAGTELLGDRLEGNGMPFEVLRTSPGAILLRFDKRLSLSLGVTIPAPHVKLGKGHRWLQRAVPELFAAELENIPYLSSTMAARAMPKGKRQGRVAMAVAKRNKTPLVLATEVLPAADKQIVLIARVFDAKGKKLFEASEVGPEGSVPALVSKLCAKIDAKVLERLGKSKHRDLMAAAKVGRVAPEPMPAEAGTVRIGEVQLANVFPAKLDAYRTRSAGKVTVTLDGDTMAKDVRIRVFVPGYMSLPTEVTMDELKAGTQTVDVKMAFDANKLLALGENVPAQAEVQIEARLGGAKASDKRIVPVMLYGRNVIDWADDAPITAFVTPQEDTVVSMARSVAKTNIEGEVSSGLKNAVLMHQALAAGGFKYIKDPIRPAKGRVLDTVQFARETLKYRTGDCDDLSVLYASLLESVGVETAIILLPGHVLVGVAPGTGVDGVGQITVDPNRYIVHEDRVFLPIETTLVGKSFNEAWAVGAKEVARWQKEGKVEVLMTRAGWAKHPPSPLPKENLGGKALVADAAKTQAQLTQIASSRLGEIDARKATLSAAVKKDPSGPSANEYAWLLSQTDELDAAVAVLKAAVDARPETASFRMNLGNALLLSGKTLPAIGAYRKAESHMDGATARGNLLSNLGVAYYLAGDEKQAKRAFASAHNVGGRSLAKEVGVDETARAADVAKSRSVAERDIQSLLLKALAEDADKKGVNEKNKKERFKKALTSGGRRGDDPESRRRLVDLLRWSR